MVKTIPEAKPFALSPHYSFLFGQSLPDSRISSGPASFIAITLSPSIPPTPLPDGGHTGQGLQDNEGPRIEQPE